DQEIARTVDEAQAAVAPFADVAGVHPAVRAEHCQRGFGLVPIALEQIGRAHENLAVVSQPHLQPPDHATDIPWAREGSLLAADDAAGRLGLTVYLADIDTQHVPDGHGFRRQRCTTTDHEPQIGETDLVADGETHGGAPEGVRARRRGARRTGPATLDVAARERHRVP